MGERHDISGSDQSVAVPVMIDLADWEALQDYARKHPGIGLSVDGIVSCQIKKFLRLGDDERLASLYDPFRLIREQGVPVESLPIPNLWSCGHPQKNG